MLFRRLLFAAIVCPALALHAAETKRYDVVIVGGGAGGTAAAVQAARLGAKVALIEETDYLGGQMGAAGVSSMDEGGPLEVDSGIYAEFLGRLKAHYDKLGKSIGTCYYRKSHHCGEPSAVQAVLYEMIGDAHKGGQTLDVYLHAHVTKVLSNGNTVTGAITDTGLTLQSHILVDATEFGDVLPLTPAAYRLANAKSDKLDPAACVQGLTWVAIIKKYPNGVPPGLQMKNPPPGYNKDIFSKSLYAGAPVGKEYQAPVDFVRHNAYRGLPDSSNPQNYDATMPEQITKTEINWFNDLPMRAKDFTAKQREKTVCEAKLKTLQNLYYIQHDLGESLWSVANDEGYDTAYNQQHHCANIPEEFRAIERNMPQEPYVRESRRLIGEHTLTGGEILRTTANPRAAVSFTSSIATNDYRPDLHGCFQEPTLEHDLEHEADRPEIDHPAGPFQIPIESLIPLKVDGLLAAEKNISQSRFVNGSTRLQPIVMLTGQAVGTLAAIASKENMQPRYVRVEEVQRSLLANGSTLAYDDLKDMPHGSPAWQAAQFALVHHWMEANRGNFLPDEIVTPEQAHQMLTQAFPHLTLQSGAITTAEQFLEAAKRAHLITSKPAFTFGNQPLTRIRAAQILYAFSE
ncbi:FAD-dependent oxidoreductase [Granulicella cerasi]|uniref:FAD-dependent oxidoreductase n=1 Tax=Granulicella cerasi TaxID=741063 RepID=A0ABW1ZBV7_9BACT|nr:FAD-dependent oxidoreductase [Granulicella cerasi]